MSRLLSRFRLMQPLPLLAIDLSGDAPELELYRETLLRVHSVTQPGHGEGDPDQISLWQLVELLTDLEPHLARFASQSGEGEKSRYGSDAGWTQIWKAISVKNVLW